MILVYLAWIPILLVVLSIFFFLSVTHLLFYDKKSDLHPRVCRLGAPTTLAHARWLDLLVFETAIEIDCYVSSISEYVGARGTFGNKIMISATGLLALSQLFLAWGYYETGKNPVLLTISSIGLFMVGICDSAVDWTILPYAIACKQDQAILDHYEERKRVKTGDGIENKGKTMFGWIHSLSALIFIALQCVVFLFDSQWVVCMLCWISLCSFLFFCAMQYIAGNYDDVLPSVLTLKKKYFPKKDLQRSEEMNRRLSLVFLFFESITFLPLAVLMSVKIIAGSF